MYEEAIDDMTREIHKLKKELVAANGSGDSTERERLKFQLIDLHNARDALVAEKIVRQFIKSPGSNSRVQEDTLIAIAKEGMRCGSTDHKSGFYLFFSDMLEKIRVKQDEYGDSWKTIPVDELRDRLVKTYNDWSCSTCNECLEHPDELGAFVDLANMSMLVWSRLQSDKKTKFESGGVQTV